MMMKLLILLSSSNVLVSGFATPASLSAPTRTGAYGDQSSTALLNGIASGKTVFEPLLEDFGGGSAGITLIGLMQPKDHCYVWYNTDYEGNLEAASADPPASGSMRETLQKPKVMLGISAVACAAFLLKQVYAHLQLPALGYLYKAYPIRASIVTCGIKSMVADFISQVRAWDFQGSFDFCTRQASSYITYGSLCLGMGSGIMYNHLMPALFPNIGTGVGSIATQACFDNFFLAPLFWIPPAYIIKSLFFPDHKYEIDLDPTHRETYFFTHRQTMVSTLAFVRQNVWQGLLNYWDDIKKEGLLIKYWSLWVPAQMITFSQLIPRHLRSPTMAAISFCWLLILMNLPSKNDNEVKESS